MKVLTTHNLDEGKYEVLDVVHGVSIRSFSFFRQFLGGLRSLVGGKAVEFEEKYLEAWNESWNEMIAAAEKRGATAIYGASINVSEISMGQSDGMILIASSGTAVKSKTQAGGRKKTVKKIKKVKKSRR